MHCVIVHDTTVEGDDTSVFADTFNKNGTVRVMYRRRRPCEAGNMTLALCRTFVMLSRGRMLTSGVRRRTPFLAPRPVQLLLSCRLVRYDLRKCRISQRIIICRTYLCLWLDGGNSGPHFAWYEFLYGGRTNVYISVIVIDGLLVVCFVRQCVWTSSESSGYLDSNRDNEAPEICFREGFAEFQNEVSWDLTAMERFDKRTRLNQVYTLMLDDLLWRQIDFLWRRHEVVIPPKRLPHTLSV